MQILEVWCPEPEGMTLRSVRIATPSVDRMLKWERQLSKVPNFLSKENPLGIFLAYDTVTFEVDDVGLMILAAIHHQRSAHAHITFWDKRLRGREGLVRTTAEWAMTAFNLEYIWTAIPKSSSRVLAFAERIGFLWWKPVGDEAVTLKLIRGQGRNGT